MYQYKFRILLIESPYNEHHNTHIIVNNKFDTITTLFKSFAIFVKTLHFRDFQRFRF